MRQWIFALSLVDLSIRRSQMPVTLEGYFSLNLKSVCKDVECTFGILKKRWKILNNGLLYQDICSCKKIFVTCCCIHNFLLDLMVRNNIRVGGLGTQLVMMDCGWMGIQLPTNTRQRDSLQSSLVNEGHCWQKICVCFARGDQLPSSCFLFFLLNSLG